MKRKLLSLLFLPLVLSGCVSGRGWQGLIPDKDVEITNPVLIVATPWGTQTLKADRIATRVDPVGKNSSGPQSLPALIPETQP